MSYLETEGAEAVQRRWKRHLRDLTNEVKQHITQEIGTLMSQIDRLNTAVDKELADDSAQNELIAELRRQLDEAKAAVDGAVAGEAAAVENLNNALNAADDAASRLESNDPQPEEPEPTEPA
jgi:predicted  nucleic acid-binding Zn-ribbon protein